ncbi:hypothetical protein GOBAR_AA36405 [Gossypium barbadense]|uniref:Uncharacterized protein n=1 Tax=Gossypium barbadense TaxID=3634 RepID=A0A2P5VZP7_GOSBA|nr:hypothetical protein GOBAR_AA36405 [Gossypium barbadense]
MTINVIPDRCDTSANSTLLSPVSTRDVTTSTVVFEISCGSEVLHSYEWQSYSVVLTRLSSVQAARAYPIIQEQRTFLERLSLRFNPLDDSANTDKDPTRSHERWITVMTPATR